MKKIIEFPLDGGDYVLVEVEESSSKTNGRIGLREDVIDQAKKSFDSAITTIQPIANTIIDKVKSLNQPADEVEVKFGLKMSAELGAVVASGNLEANYEITLKWKK